MQLRRNKQRGNVTVEFVLVAPILAFAMLFLIGLGYTVMTKQNAVVGARAAVYYRVQRDEVPQPAAVNEMIKSAVSPGRENWALEFHEGHMENPNTGFFEIIGNVVGRIYQGFNKDTRYTARGSATLGFLPRIMNFGQAQSTHHLPRGTWTCEQTGGASYTSVLLGQVGLPSPINGWLELTKCETYSASFR